MMVGQFLFGVLRQANVVVRSVTSLAPALGIIPKPGAHREDGISAVVTIRNEPWLEPALLSIRGLVDEVVITDSSTIDISRTIKKLEREGMNIKYERMSPGIPGQLERAIKLSTKKWILRWDGDVIAYTSGEKDVMRLKKFIDKIPPWKYCYVHFKLLQVDQDFFHTRKAFHREAYLFNYSPALVKRGRLLRKLVGCLRVVLIKKTQQEFRHVPFPIEYAVEDINGAFGLHIRDLKPQEKLMERRRQRTWSLLPEKEKREKYGNSLERYVAATEPDKRLKALEGLREFDWQRYGHPQVLKEWLREEWGLRMAPTKEFNKRVDAHILEFAERIGGNKKKRAQKERGKTKC